MTVIGERFIFLHVPKTGGKWVTRVLEIIGAEVIPIAPHADLRSVSTFGGRIRVAFVREPLSWYQSWWRHRHTFGDWNESEPLDRFGRGSFEEFLLGVTQNLPGFCTEFFERFTGPAEMSIEFIGRYETLVDDLIEALHMAGETFDEDAVRTLAPLNVSSPNIRGEYSLEARERVKAVERRAYERFYPDEL
jgi:hypothetical protein